MPRGLVERFIEAFNEGDLDALVATLDPEVEIHSNRGVKKGIDEARAWATREPGGLQQQVKLGELRGSGDVVVALCTRQWFWAGTMDLADEQEMTYLFTVRDGRIARWQPFEDRAEALQTAGLA